MKKDHIIEDADKHQPRLIVEAGKAVCSECRTTPVNIGWGDCRQSWACKCVLSEAAWLKLIGHAD